MMFNEIFARSNFFFSGYFRVSPHGIRNYLLYQNDSQEKEILDVVVFPPEGIGKKNWKIISKVLPPRESWLLDANELSALLGEAKEGSVFLCVKGGQKFEETRAQKDLVLSWASPSGGSLFAVGPFSELNQGPTKSKKSFFMFCPVVLEKNSGIKTVNIIINHSSDPNYADTIQLTPQLSNLKGEILSGDRVTIPPFGTTVVDVEEHFGKKGIELLDMTGGYGGMTIQHAGHILVSYFFQADSDGNIICGNHTQPPAGIFGGPTTFQVFKGEVKRMFPWLMNVKGIKR